MVMTMVINTARHSKPGFGNLSAADILVSVAGR